MAFVGMFVIIFLLSGCGERNESNENERLLSDYTEFVEIPLIRQGTTYSCGIAAMHSLLRWASYDLDINDEYLMEACGTTREKGTDYLSIMEYLNDTGLLEASWQENMDFDDIKNIIQNGGVVMMPIQAWDMKESASGELVWFDGEDYKDYWAAGHWVIACGYNDIRVLFMDPSTAGTYADMTWDDLELRWHDSADYVDDDTPFTSVDHCGIVVYKTGEEEYSSDVVKPLR